MRKYLRLRVVGTQPEIVLAQEYESHESLSYIAIPELASATWASESLPTESIIELLRGRGWHQTDIYDELDEARASSSAA